ncbi:transmembrane protein 186 [Nilaparvata lugens]|uniref:transmembrane protein 186 n=1 Tax=Nilaparvata lugens TaxID=108931 RepID=UPI00193D66C2|nr:transmembrane protein 186 [Nilaparvata lugens]
MKVFAIINKLNPHFLKSSAVALPTVGGILYWLKFLDEKQLLGFFVIATTFILPLQVFSYGSQRLIGFIYLNKENDQVKISYITYMGNREDIVLPIESIMSFSDMPVTPFDYLYKKVRTFDSNTVYKIDVRFGEILDDDGFKLVFGEYKK